jgi:D-alanine-D-alanine ligase-like ATP-grasp enzyme
MKRNPAIIKEAVLKMGGTIEEFIPERGCFYINIGGKRIFLERKISLTRQTTGAGQLTRCKDVTYKLFHTNNLPTPQTECFYKKTYDAVRAKVQLEALPYPIIMKDAEGSNSKGIFPFIGNASDAMIVLEKELPRYRSMIAQEMVFGKEYRVLVLDEKVIGALEMIPPYARGDGVSTLRNIIEEKQCQTERRTEFDEKLKQLLKEQNVTLESVMSKNEIAYIKRTSCLAEGGETRDVTDSVNENIGKICITASKIVGKYLAGIDIICTDIAQDPSQQAFNILEVNGKPDLYIHYNPTHGHTRNVVEDIVKFMVKIA